MSQIIRQLSRHIPSVATLLGTPVHLLIITNIESANRVAACRHGPEGQLLFRPSDRGMTELLGLPLQFTENKVKTKKQRVSGSSVQEQS